MNRDVINKCWNVFGLQKTEIRGIGVLNGSKKIVSAWFSSVGNLITELERYEADSMQWYFVFNSVNPYNLEAKMCNNQCINKFNSTKHSISDSDIEFRRWIMIDIDPKRKSGVSSSDEELALANKVSECIYQFLSNNGFPRPVLAMSGSGYHLMYPCCVAVSEESDVMIKDFLSVLSMLFSSPEVEIDTVVHNRARLTKLYGTTAKKGSNTPERPHRDSVIKYIPNVLKNVDFRLVKAVVDKYMIKETKYSEFDNYGRKIFDVEKFLNVHGVGYKKRDVKGGYKYVLNECVFNPEHKSPDSAVFVYDDGRLGFKCFHNSCSSYHWKEFRERLEGVKIQKPVGDSKAYSEFKQILPKQEATWLRLSDINSVNSDDILHIPTNFRVLDNCLNGGLAAGGLSILTGSNGCGKTVWLNNMILNACDKGYKIGLWSGEMQNWRIKNWFHIIARGAQADTEEINDLIDKSLEDKLFVYNNNYGNNWQELFSHIRLLVEKEKAHLIVLDNLACMNINHNNIDKYEQQSLFVKDLAEYAKQSAIHIVLVAHPRKSYGIVRKEDISGSYDLSNMADNVFILHKVNEDFKKNANDFWKKSDVEFYSSFNSLIEIAKNRDKGEERLIGLFYESYSKRLKCDYAEIIHYSWELKNGLKIL
ncbi:MAG: AAA family ATPase [Bacteroidales bacterium]|nr:AAA family ATPase [Bacteroidales bacterium]